MNKTRQELYIVKGIFLKHWYTYVVQKTNIVRTNCISSTRFYFYLTKLLRVHSNSNIETNTMLRILLTEK